MFAKIAPIMGKGDATLLALILATHEYGPAKKFLRDRGWTESQVESIPALQAVLLYELAEYERQLDQQIKVIGLPYAERLTRLAEQEKLPTNEFLFARAFVPAGRKVQSSALRPERKLGALRAVEAIRMHAAKTCKLPASLAEITIVPVPNDPLTAQPFSYSLNGATATLVAPTLDVIAADQRAAFTYTITLEPK
jgi:hypothetical protein